MVHACDGVMPTHNAHMCPHTCDCVVMRLSAHAFNRAMSSHNAHTCTCIQSCYAYIQCAYMPMYVIVLCMFATHVMLIYVPRAYDCVVPAHNAQICPHILCPHSARGLQHTMYVCMRIKLCTMHEGCGIPCPCVCALCCVQCMRAAAYHVRVYAHYAVYNA